MDIVSAGFLRLRTVMKKLSIEIEGYALELEISNVVNVEVFVRRNILMFDEDKNPTTQKIFLCNIQVYSGNGSDVMVSLIKGLASNHISAAGMDKLTLSINEFWDALSAKTLSNNEIASSKDIS